MFQLQSNFQPTGDQPQAINQLVNGLSNQQKSQVLLGVTGSGKTFTIANVIQKIQKPTLIISHNKTLAGQLYQEFKEFFPHNAVSYFVSYYDYYQPESYIPRTDTYIEKTTEINEEIDKLRLAATANLMTRKDVIVVASVSAIYNLGSPKEYQNAVLEISPATRRGTVIEKLINLQYSRSDFDFKRGTFRVKGEVLDVFPSYDDFGVRVEENKITKFNPLTGKTIEILENYVVYPAKHYMTDPSKYKHVFDQIRKDKEKEVKELGVFEGHRLNQRVDYDLEMIRELGYVNGIENYSRYFDDRNVGDPPYSLLDYFPKDYLLVIDESHMTIPQIRGMYNGDRSRKQTLIDYGFRLKSALDNRPLKFDEFWNQVNQAIFVSATPDEWELEQSGHKNIAQQLIRPTGVIEPIIDLRSSKNQVQNLIAEIKIRKEKNERVLVTTLTKRMAEELAEYLTKNTEIKVAYLHSDVETLQRSDTLRKLRLGEYDVIVGVNLLREGIDLPEVTLVAILDADKEGFLRSRVALIQTMGRAARNIESKIILYADKITDSIKNATVEVERRRNYQIKWNLDHGITPFTIVKPIRENFAQMVDKKSKRIVKRNFDDINTEDLLPEQKENLKKRLEKLMRESARNLDFEGAIYYREKIKEIM